MHTDLFGAWFSKGPFVFVYEKMSVDISAMLGCSYHPRLEGGRCCEWNMLRGASA